MRKLALGLLLVAGLAGCGDDPVSFSDAVGIELKADSDKVVSSNLTDQKNITTESGNPYGAFVGDARARLGHDPVRIEVRSVTLLLGAGSTGVSSLGEIFNGDVEVLFRMNDTNDTFPVAHRTVDASTQGSGPVDFSVTWDFGAVTGDNITKLVNGSFAALYRGPAQPDYAGKAAKANLQVTFTFEAFAD